MGRVLPILLSLIFVSCIRCLPVQLYKVEDVADNELSWADKALQILEQSLVPLLTSVSLRAIEGK